MKKKIILILFVIAILFTMAGYEFEKKAKLSENISKYNDYELVNDLKKVEYASIKVLIKFDGVLYGKSNAIIDYIGGTNKVGIIDKVIPNKYVPKLNNETNAEEILNAEVYDETEKSIVLKYNNEYVLFKKINK